MIKDNKMRRCPKCNNELSLINGLAYVCLSCERKFDIHIITLENYKAKDDKNISLSLGNFILKENK